MSPLRQVASISSRNNCSNTDYCKVDCTGCSDVWSKIPDPSNCRRYYVCEREKLFSEMPFECPFGRVFHPDRKACILGYFCNSPCKHIAQCHYSCQPGTQYYLTASSYDCSIYHVCDGVTTKPVATRKCDVHIPYFNGVLCQTNVTECCDCQPHCSADDLGKAVQDPLDCRRYFECMVIGRPVFPLTCDPGTHFVPETGQCSPLAPCITVCPNKVGVDGCIEPFSCFYKGYFPKCVTHCSPYYYHCPYDDGRYAKEFSCLPRYVFHQSLQGCVSEMYGCITVPPPHNLTHAFYKVSTRP